MKYIGHNQWDGYEKFKQFCHRIENEEFDKIIMFCQNEWQWYNNHPEYWPSFLEYIQANNKNVHALIGAGEQDFPVTVDGIQSHYWLTAWFGRAYTGAVRVNQHNLFINPYDKKDYKYHFYNLNHRTKSHRCYVIDQLARHNLIDSNLVSIHDTEVYSGMVNEGWRTWSWKYFQYRPIEVDHAEFRPNMHKQMFTVSPFHHETFCALIPETTDRSYFITEKTLMPLLIGKPFLVASRQGFHKVLQDLGFALYDEIFDYSFDSIVDEEQRYEVLVENYKRINEIPLDRLHDLQLKVADKIIHNKNRVREIVYNYDLYPALVKEILEHHERTGEEVDHLLVALHIEQEHWRDFRF